MFDLETLYKEPFGKQQPQSLSELFSKLDVPKVPQVPKIISNAPSPSVKYTTAVSPLMYDPIKAEEMMSRWARTGNVSALRENRRVLSEFFGTERVSLAILEAQLNRSS